MKFKACFYVLFFFQMFTLYVISSAQTKQGIYLTKRDFIQKIITPDQGVNKIQTKNIFIILKTDKITFKVNKDSIFGYQDNNNFYRFNHADGKEYCLVENGELIIYIRYETEYENKNAIREPHYYFSINLDSKIYPLSIITIKKVFPENEKLHNALDLEFYQKEISIYNNSLNTYQINFLVKKYK